VRLRRRRSVAIAGAGGAAGIHAAAAKPAGLRVAAVASAGGRSARALAGEAGARRVDPADLPAGAAVLVVATPVASHLELTERGLRAGAQVLVESPWWTDVADARSAVEADRAGPGTVRGALNLRSSPLWRRALQERSQLDAPGHVSGAIHQPAPDWGHLRGRAEVDGPLVRLGATAVTLALDLAGPDWPEVERVRAGRSGTEGWIDLELPGLVVHLELGHSGEPSVWFQAAGDDAVLRVECSPVPGLERNGAPIDVRGSADPLTTTGYVDQLAGLGGPGDLTLDADQMLLVTSVLDAAERSAAEDGRPRTPGAD